MPGVIEKVTAFVTRSSRNGRELLLFEHPFAGIQIPAGTVEAGESPEVAAIREVREETRLEVNFTERFLGAEEERLPESQRVIATPTRVYARPDVTSFDWAYVRRGITVVVVRRAGTWLQITYEEFDRVPDPQYVTLCITGWVPAAVLADLRRRYFFHFECGECSGNSWTVHSDNHDFVLFWAPLAALPTIIPPQDRWLAFLGRRFSELNVYDASSE